MISRELYKEVVFGKNSDISIAYIEIVSNEQIFTKIKNSYICHIDNKPICDFVFLAKKWAIKNNLQIVSYPIREGLFCASVIYPEDNYALFTTSEDSETQAILTASAWILKSIKNNEINHLIFDKRQSKQRINKC